MFKKLIYARLGAFHLGLAATLALILMGCGTATVRPSGCEVSVIYDHLQNPEMVSALEVVAVSGVAEKNPVIKPYLLKFSNDALAALRDDNLTYFDLGKLLLAQTQWINSYYGRLLMATSDIFASLDSSLPISECDRGFLVRHFQRQITALGE